MSAGDLAYNGYSIDQLLQIVLKRLLNFLSTKADILTLVSMRSVESSENTEIALQLLFHTEVNASDTL